MFIAGVSVCIRATNAVIRGPKETASKAVHESAVRYVGNHPNPPAPKRQDAFWTHDQLNDIEMHAELGRFQVERLVKSWERQFNGDAT